mgnify:CR=1 FL=1
MQRLTCDCCRKATIDPCNGEFEAGCESCMARMLASCPDWYPQGKAGSFAEYEEALRTLFAPDRQWEAHYEVKHWVNLIKQQKSKVL